MQSVCGLYFSVYFYQLSMHNNYCKECANCGNINVGIIKRGIIREAIPGGPGTVVDFIPVGGKWIWKGTKEVVLRVLKTDIDKWGDELEKWVYKDIQVEFDCPKCGKKWTETHQLNDSEYKQIIADYVDKAKELVGLNQEVQKVKMSIGTDRKAITTNQNSKHLINMRLQIPYNEIENYIQEKYQQKIGLSFVDDHTVSLSKKVWIKDVSVNISVIQIAGNEILLQYQSNVGIEWIIKGALVWFKENIIDFMEEQEDNKLLIHLDKIEQLSKALDQIEILTIDFQNSLINATFRLKV